MRDADRHRLGGPAIDGDFAPLKADDMGQLSAHEGDGVFDGHVPTLEAQPDPVKCLDQVPKALLDPALRPKQRDVLRLPNRRCTALSSQCALPLEPSRPAPTLKRIPDLPWPSLLLSVPRRPSPQPRHEPGHMVPVLGPLRFVVSALVPRLPNLGKTLSSKRRNWAGTKPDYAGPRPCRAGVHSL
jgi:hypothetical protein